MESNRRQFLGLATLTGVVAMAEGCAMRTGSVAVSGAPMQDFAVKPLKRIRVGVVGLGTRGGWAVNRLSMVPGVDVCAVCDIERDRVDGKIAWARENGKPDIRGFSGSAESYRALCEWEGIDVVYNATPWQLHAPIALCALDAGKHVFNEVPAVMTVDDAWALVEKAEKTRLHCMQLENSCYHELSLAGLMMVRAGVFGELTHAQAGYIHDLTQYNWEGYWKQWRLAWNREHTGDQYPTHDLGPIAQAMDITRGDYFDYLVSLSSPQQGFELWAKEHLGAEDPRRRMCIAMGDMTTTLIRTKRGKSIMLQHDVSTPRPRVGRFLVQGPGGYFNADIPEICYRDTSHKGSSHHLPLDKDRLEFELRKYAHPLWRKAGEIAKLVGGHGGMDFMMDLRWAYCLQNGLPLDQDVYELAAWCATCELSELSVLSGSIPQKYPDFTRGAWKTALRRPMADIDLSKLDFVGKQLKKEASS